MDTHSIHTRVVQVPMIGLELECDLRRHTLLVLLREREREIEGGMDEERVQLYLDIKGLYWWQ